MDGETSRISSEYFSQSPGNSVNRPLPGYKGLKIQRTRPIEDSVGLDEMSHLSLWLSHPSNRLSYISQTASEYELSALWWMQYAKFSGLTAWMEDKPVAMGVLQLEPFARIKHTCELSIVVDPAMQRRGIGKALVHELCKFGRQVFGIERVHIQVHSGSRSFKFYQDMGFEEFGRQKKWIKEDDGSYRARIFMEMKI